MKQQLSFDSMPNFIGQSNVEIEELVLGCFINYPETFYQLSDQVSVKDFTRSETRYLFQSILEVSKTSKIDIATITDMIVKKKYVDLVYTEKQLNLNVYLENICERVDSDAHIKEHLTILNGYNQRRELFSLSRDINEACNDSQETGIILNMINQSVLNIQNMGEVKDFSVDDSINEMMEDLDSEDAKGVKTGIPKLDKFIYQFDLNNLIVVAGAPSMGKTAFVLEIFKNALMKFDYKPLFFSLEMSRLELTKRMVSSYSCIELRKLRDKKKMDPIDKQDITKAANKFRQKEYFIDDKARKLSKILNSIRKHVIRYGTKLVIIDYLQLISYTSKSGSREQEIATISRSLKEIAAELGIVVIALSQLNRQVNARVNKRPVLSDLRESGAIEQDADMVLFPYRPAYYEMSEKGIPAMENDVELIIAKGRSTGVGTVHMTYISRYVKFVSDFKENEKIQILASQSIGVPNYQVQPGVGGDSHQSSMEFGQKSPQV